MITYESMPMILRTLIAAVLFMTLIAGVCTAVWVGKKQGRMKLALLVIFTAVIAAMHLLYTSTIPAERAKPMIPEISLWFARRSIVVPLLCWLMIAVFFALVIVEEIGRRKNAVTASSIKESLDRLETGLCFSYPNGLVLLSNYRMNELSHAIVGTRIQNANLFWDALITGRCTPDVRRMSGGKQAEYALPDGTIWLFQREKLDGVIQITAADTTRQHQMLSDLQDRQSDLEEMNERIRAYGEKVDDYVIARERLETRVNLHGFLGQALLMTRHYLQYESGDPKKIIDIWQRNVDVLRLEAEPQAETDSFTSLKNAASAIGMQVHVAGRLPEHTQLRKLSASLGAEMLTNAVRHAGAKQLFIDVEESDDGYIIRYTNDGAVPRGAVTEGGGLSTARRKIEAAGGRMQIETAPRFMLTVLFGKEVSRDV